MQCPHGFFGILDELFLRRLIYAGQLMQLNKDYFFFPPRISDELSLYRTI